MTLLDNKQCHQVRKGFIAFLLDDIACQQAMTSCKKGVYRFLTWWHCLSTFLVDSELILHNKSASQLGMLTLKKEHKSYIAQFYRLWAKLDGHFFSVLHPKKSDFFTSPKNSTLSDLEELFLHIWQNQVKILILTYCMWLCTFLPILGDEILKLLLSLFITTFLWNM